jgi:zinc transport system substrate-binding protein
MRINRMLTVAVATLALAVAASSVNAAGASGKLTVYVVNYPLQYLAERIGGDHVEIFFPAPEDEDPAYWNPDTATVTAYQKADLILLNGAGYAKWVKKVSLPRAKMVDTSKSFKDRFVTSEEIATHTHGPEGKHAHESLAFTTWLDFALAAEQARAITDAFGRKTPSKKDVFEKNYAALEQELAELDRRVREMAAADPSRPLIASHPVYQYLARRNGLNIRSVHWEPDEVPGPEEWSELRALLREHPAKWMIWEGEPSVEVAAALDTMGVGSLVFDPASNAPAEGDFLTVMERNITVMERAFR